MNILITICARGGSKGIPGKNIRAIGGKPLIAYSILTAQRFAEQYQADISLSTDDEEIRATAAKYGLTTSYRRPDDLATDQAGKVDTITDLLRHEEMTKNKQYDYVLDLDVTSPLRTVDDLQKAFTIISNDKEALVLFSVNTANRNPYFNMVEKNTDGYYDLVKKGAFLTRQSAPSVYDMNASFYFYKKAFFEKGLRSVITDRSLVYIMPHLCFDLDHMIDFEFLSFLVDHNKLLFEL